MSRKRKIIVGVLIFLVVGLAFLYAQLDIARQSIQFDLGTIGRSIYQARTKNKNWPAQIDDLVGTDYLNLPYRRTLLEEKQFVIVWQQDLDPNPLRNRDRVLAYDNASLLSRFGWVLVCRGDLRTEYMDADQLQTYLRRQEQRGLGFPETHLKIVFDVKSWAPRSFAHGANLPIYSVCFSALRHSAQRLTLPISHRCCAAVIVSLGLDLEVRFTNLRWGTIVYTLQV